MLEVKGLSVSYGQHRALEDVSIRVAPGEIVVILGANGAGKSTLLKAIAGVCEGRAAGAVTLGGEDLLGRRPHAIVDAGLALVPAGRGVFGDLTVQENLVLGAYPDRARNDEASNIERVLALFPKLRERLRQTVRTMSGGEQQMVALGRAMMSNPDILALDEPSLGLSPLLCRDLFQSLSQVRKAGIAVLLVEQNAKQSLRIADRGYLLENGTILHEDKADVMAKDPAVQKAYLGGGGASAPKAARQVPQPASAPARPPRGPSPDDIAAAALARVAPQPRPSPQVEAVKPPVMATPIQNGHAAPAKPPPAPPARPVPSTPDLSSLVAQASQKASRRPNGKIAPRPKPAPVETRAPAAAPPAAPADRLRAMIEEIETAARRAEAYRPGSARR